MKKFDKTALIVLGAGICLLVLVVIFNSQRPIQVTCENSDCTLVNPYIALSLEFSKAVDAELVSQYWQTEPAVQGHWEWHDERHATWYTESPLPSGTVINAMLQAKASGKDGSDISEDAAWTVTVRNPAILTIQNTPDSGQEIFMTELDSGATTQLTFTEGRVSTFEPAPDGEKIIASVENDAGGLDLWLMERDGSDNHILLDCGTERCLSPAWSLSSKKIAYTRESGAESSQGQIWLLDVENGETAPLFDNAEKGGYDPQWSPDGAWLTYWNTLEGGIQIIRIESGETHLLESYNGDTGCWSTDSQTFYFANTNLGETAFQNMIMKADFQESTIETFLSGEIDDSGLNYDNPVCSRGLDLMAVSVQPNTNIPGKELAVIDLNTMETISVLNDLTRIPNCYEWTPFGDMLMFQLNAHNAAQEEIEIWIWDTKTQQAQIILQGARAPAWLP